MVVRAGRLRRVGAPAVGCPAPGQPGAADRAGPGLGRRHGGAVGVERRRGGRGRLAAARGLGGVTRRAAAAGAGGHRRTGCPAPPGVRPRQARRARQALRHGARRVRGGDRRRCARRPGARTRLDELPSPAALPDLRRDAPPGRGPARPGPHRGRRLVPRLPRVHREAAVVRRPDRRLRAARGGPPRRDAHGRHDRRPVAVDRRGRDAGRPVQGRDGRLPARS